MKRILGCLTLGAVIAAGCEEKVLNRMDAGGDVPVNMIVSVSDMTRAGEETLPEGGKLGLYAFRHKANQEDAFMGVRHFDNLPLTIVGGQAQADSPVYFPKYDDKTDFYMYYPYVDKQIESSDIYQSMVFYDDQSTEEYYSLSDKMLGVTLNVEKSPSPVRFRMKRLMSRVAFRLKPGTGFGNVYEMTSAEIMLKNIKNAAALDCISGKLSEPTTPTDIIPHGTFIENYREGLADGVDVLIIPQKIYKGSVLFIVSIGDRKFNGILEKDISFEAGKQYTFTMTVNRVVNGDSVTIVPEITDWTQGLVADGDVIEVDPDADANYVMDIDGNEYRIITMGTQRWMGENLKVTRFNDGTPIRNIVDQAEWDLTEKGEVPGWCYYDNDPENGKKYGALYNWYAVMPGKICPEGWHVPTVDDFKKLILFLGENPGVKLKAREGWYDVDNISKPEYQGTDEYGFNAHPGGNRRYQDGFQRKDMYGEWWTSEMHEQYSTSAHMFYVYAKYKDLRTLYHLKETGHAIRCIKD